MSDAANASGHPSPKRSEAHPVLLTITLMAGPAAWITQLLGSYGLSSYLCQPHGDPRLAAPPAWSAVWGVLLALNLVCVGAVAAGALCGLMVWRRTGSEKPGGGPVLLEIGEGRARFLAACGMMACAEFALAILFNTVEFFTVPACWRFGT